MSRVGPSSRRVCPAWGRRVDVSVPRGAVESALTSQPREEAVTVDDEGWGAHEMPTPNGIGVAISHERLIAHPNRRSRSAAAMHELAKEQEAKHEKETRRRSSEMRYWRASRIDSMPFDNLLHRKSCAMLSVTHLNPASVVYSRLLYRYLMGWGLLVEE